MEPNRFDEILRHKTEGFEATPPAEMFSRIESSMAKIDVAAQTAAQPAVPRRVRLWSRPMVRYAAAVVAVGAVATAVVTVNRPLTEPQTAQEIIETVEPTVEAAEPVAESETLMAAAIASKPSSYSAIPTEKRAAADAATVEAKSVAESDKTLPTATDNTPDSGKLPEKARPTTKRSTEQTKGATVYSDAELDAYWREVLAEDKRGTESVNHFSTTLYAGNIGVGRGDMNLSNITDDPLLVSENLLSSAPQNQFTSLPTLSPSVSEENKLEHRMPVSFGLSVSYSFGQALSVESGLIYTKMFSASSSTGTTSDYDRRRDLHYLGIPVAFTCRLFEVKNIGFYTRVGGTVEKCIYGIDRIYVDGAYNTAKEWEVRELQFSIDASVGVQYPLWRGLSVYGEGGISYYFQSATQPESYRTANPLNAALRFGFRYAFL